MENLLQFTSSRKSLGLPGAYYDDSQIFTREQREIWHHTWQFVARDADLPSPGDYITCTLGQESILVVRMADGSLQAMHNVCRHRGARLLDSRGNCQKQITCPFHAWTYGLDGQLLAVKKPQLFPNIEKSSFHLVPARVDTWKGFIFVNADAQGESLADYLAEMPNFLEQYHQDWSSLQEVDRWFYDAPANWKLVVENYIEDYHFDVVHDRSFKSLYDLDNIETIPTGRHIKIPVPYSKKPPIAFYQSVWDKGKTSYQGYVFPNMMVNTERDHVSVFRLVPLSAKRTRVEVILYQSPLQPTYNPNQLEEIRKEFDGFIEEDSQIYCQIQANVRSRAYQVTAVANMHESGISHFHNVLAEYLEI